MRKRFMRFVMALLLFIFFPLLTHAQIIHRTLQNGMEVLIKENHTAPVVSMRVCVKVGSIYEQEYLGSGISHYIEHIVSGGTTKKRTEDETKKILQSIGGATNAYTSSDHTCYYISTSILYFDTVIDLLSDWVFNCSFDENEVEREKGVILKEIKMRDDEPEVRLTELYNKTVFKFHPEKYPIIGISELFKKITREDLVKFYSRMYVPNNMIVSAVGDFNATEVMDKIESAFSNFQPSILPPLYLPSDPAQLGRRYVEDEMDVETSYLVVGFRTVPIFHEDVYALDLLAVILGEGDSSRLRRRLKDKKQLVYSISAHSYTPAYDAGDFTVHANLKPENLQQTEKEIFEEIFRLKKEFVEKTELDKAKKIIISQYVFSNQTVENQSGNMARDFITTGNADFSQYYLKRIKEITEKEIRDVVRKYFYEDRATIAVIKPRKKITTKQQVDLSKAEESKVQKAIDINLQEDSHLKVKKYVLKNGLTLIFKRNTCNDVVAVKMTLRGGSRYEDERKNGIFNATSRMLIKGTKTRSAEQISKELNMLGTEISSFADEDFTNVAMKIIKDDFKKGFDIFSDVIINPIFPAGEWEKEKKVILGEIDRQNDDWQVYSENFFRFNFYKTHPYRFNPLGQKQCIESIKSVDLKKIHKKYFVPNNMVLAIFGNLSFEEVKLLVEKKFGALKKSEEVLISTPAEEKFNETLKVEKKTEREQAVIFIGYRGMKLGDKDWYTMRVIDAIISGIGYPSGWLHETLRSKQLVYFVHAWNKVMFDEGYFAIQAGTSNEKVQEALSIINDKIRKIKEEFPTDEEFENAKRMCIVTENLFFKQTNDSQANIASLYEIAGLGYDFRDNYDEMIQKVTKEEIKLVANKYFTNSLITIIYGKE